MSSSRVVLSLGISVLVVGAFLVGFSLRTDPGVGSSIRDERIEALESSLAHVSARVESVEARDGLDAPLGASRSDSSSSDTPDSEPGDNDSERELNSDEEPLEDDADDAALAKIGELERRVRALEEDPIERGYNYVESENPQLRVRGLRALSTIAKLDPEARDTVRRLATDEDPSVRETAIDVLSDIGDKDSVPLFLDALADENPAVRREAIDAFDDTRTTEHAMDVAKLVRDPDASVRRQAADTLGRLKTPEAAEFLLGALSDDSEEVRGQAISSLGEIGAKDAAPTLRTLYDQNPGPHRWRLVTALRTLGDKQPYSAEVDRLSETVRSGQSERERRDAVYTLARYARRDASEVLQAALQDPSPRVREAANRVMRRR